MDNSYRTFLETPIGFLEIVGSGKGIFSIMFADGKESARCDPVLDTCRTQLVEYFEGKRTSFSLQLAPRGTDFQKKVWTELMNIPFGKTITYLELAQLVGNPRSTRAVGNANGKNLLSIVVPCHRVVGSDGSLTGYEGGLWRKEWLLAHERKFRS